MGLIGRATCTPVYSRGGKLTSGDRLMVRASLGQITVSYACGSRPRREGAHAGDRCPSASASARVEERSESSLCVTSSYANHARYGYPGIDAGDDTIARIETTVRRDHETTRPRDHETTRPRDHETTRPRDHETTRPRDHETTRPRDGSFAAGAKGFPVLSRRATPPATIGWLRRASLDRRGPRFPWGRPRGRTLRLVGCPPTSKRGPSRRAR
jgi:hypothetical protein